jgi:hypothetical protein
MLDIFKKARQLVANGWTQSTPARSANGTVCFYGDEDATHFCAVGALFRAVNDNVEGEDERFKEKLKISMKLSEQLPSNISIPTWNDDKNRKQEEVLDLFDKIISKYEESSSQL